MTTTRLHPHHSLPAPVVHAGFSISQSKSHVLAGVQDAYWSDDEAVSGKDIFLNIGIDLPGKKNRRTPSVHYAWKKWTYPISISSPVFVGIRYVYCFSTQLLLDLALPRFVGSVGTTSKRTSTSGALLVGVFTPTTRLNLNQLPRKSEPPLSTSIYVGCRLTIAFIDLSAISDLCSKRNNASGSARN